MLKGVNYQAKLSQKYEFFPVIRQHIWLMFIRAGSKIGVQLHWAVGVGI